MKWFWIMWSMNVFHLWVFISKFSKNLFFDGILFDVLVFTSYTISLGIMTKSFSKFGLLQRVGLGMIWVGIILVKVKG